LLKESDFQGYCSVGQGAYSVGLSTARVIQLVNERRIRSVAVPGLGHLIVLADLVSYVEKRKQKAGRA
jgi:hypothetical protein